jgi:methylated-DNA-[protein]-cysteine S-methyltransferase
MENWLYPSSIGELEVEMNGEELVGILFEPRPGEKMEVLKDGRVKKELDEYFSGKRQVFDLVMKYEGSEFRKKVWEEIAKIPFGETITYMELARRVGNVKAIRAAASACGKNPLPIVIPCHRVLGSNGSLGGFGGGLWRKRWLLEWEDKIINSKQ